MKNTLNKTMKASKKLQKQFADFKAEFAALCRQFGGARHPRGEHTGGENSCFEIKTPWGTVHASIGVPWGIDMELYPGERHRSSTAIFLKLADYRELPPFWCDPCDGRPHWKWNIHRSIDAGGMYLECCNEALSEFARRLARVATESGVQS